MAAMAAMAAMGSLWAAWRLLWGHFGPLQGHSKAYARVLCVHTSEIKPTPVSLITIVACFSINCIGWLVWGHFLIPFMLWIRLIHLLRFFIYVAVAYKCLFTAVTVAVAYNCILTAVTASVAVAYNCLFTAVTVAVAYNCLYSCHCCL